jgi:hypothetical protein
MSPVKPRDPVLVKLTPRAGWQPDRKEHLDRLWALLSDTHPGLDETRARNRLAPLFPKAAELLQLGLRGGKKPTTFIRNEIQRSLKMPEDEAVEQLQRPDAVLADYLDLRLEAHDPEFRGGDAASSPDDLIELGRRRYALLKEHLEELLPQVESGPEAVWATIAGLVAEALIDITGRWPGRVVAVGDETEGEEKGWGREFFRTFAGLVLSSLPPGARAEQPLKASFDKVWRKALRRLEAEGARPAPPPRWARRRI